MSLILFLESQEGFILAGDSRLTYLNSGKYEDKTYKVFNYNNRIGIAFHGAADINGQPLDKILHEFVTNPKSNPTIKEVTYSLRNFIRKQKADLSTTFYILGYEEKKKTVFKFDLSKNEVIDLSYIVHGCGGDDSVAWSYIEGHCEKHQTKQQALWLVDNIYRESMKRFNTIGGAVDILFISKAGIASWMKRK